MPASLQHTLDFLDDLCLNNNRVWFKANRDRYELARAAYADVLSELIARFDVVDDLGGISPEACMYRINRDVRFSADKSPYKTWFGALLGKQGRKSETLWTYFQVAPKGNSLVAAGAYRPSPEQVKFIRDTIAADSSPLRKLITAPTFKSLFGSLEGDALKTAPKGYPKDHPDIDLLRLKQWLATRDLTVDDLLRDDLVDYVLEIAGAMKPFAHYIANLLERAPKADRPPRER